MKRKKVTRQRAGKTHGWGSKKKHRGAGNRGGRGNAGSGKRADQKKPSYWNNLITKKSGQKRGKNYFGKYGFGMIAGKALDVITLKDLDACLPKLVAEKKASHTGGVYTVNLSDAGFGKLLGTGQFTKKAKITVIAASAGAIEKVSAAGGSVGLIVKAETPKAEA